MPDSTTSTISTNSSMCRRTVECAIGGSTRASGVVIGDALSHVTTKDQFGLVAGGGGNGLFTAESAEDAEVRRGGVGPAVSARGISQQVVFNRHRYGRSHASAPRPSA